MQAACGRSCTRHTHAVRRRPVIASSMVNPSRTMLLPMMVCAAVASTLTACARPSEDADRRSAIPTSPGRPGESEAKRLHRHGVNCMETLERPDCAKKYFEDLVALNPKRERELVGDALFRLVWIYDREGDDARVTELIRRFWELGTAGGSAGLLPWSASFLPTEVTTMFAIDVQRLESSKLWRELSPDSKDTMFSCDESRRDELKAQQKERREARRAKLEADAAAEGKPPPPKPEERRRRGPRRDRNETAPVYGDGMCPLVRAIGLDDLRGLLRITNASSHADPTISASIAEVEELDARLAAAVAEGRLVAESERRYRLDSFKYADAPTYLLRLDSDELVMVPEKGVAAMEGAVEARTTTLSAGMTKLLEQIPRDAVFYTAIDRPAMLAGIESFGPIGSLLPVPDGMLIASVCYAHAGVFVRIPTESELRVQILAAILRRILEGQAQKAEESGSDSEAELFREMDVTTAPDGGALLFSIVLSAAQVERIFLD